MKILIEIINEMPNLIDFVVWWVLFKKRKRKKKEEEEEEVNGLIC